VDQDDVVSTHWASTREWRVARALVVVQRRRENLYVGDRQIRRSPRRRKIDAGMRNFYTSRSNWSQNRAG